MVELPEVNASLPVAAEAKDDAEGLIVAKMIIMIYAFNKLNDSAVIVDLRKKWGLENWSVAELSADFATTELPLQEPALQQLTLGCARSIAQLLSHEEQFYKNLKKFVLPTYINDQGIAEYGGWERLKKYLDKADIDDLNETIGCLRMLCNIYQARQFTPHAVLGYLMNGLEVRNPVIYRRFWLEYFYLSAHDSNSPNPLFHSSLPYLSISIFSMCADKNKSAQQKICNKFKGRSSLAMQLKDDDLAFFERQPLAYINNAFKRPADVMPVYSYLFDVISKNIPNGDPLKSKMEEVAKRACAVRRETIAICDYEHDLNHCTKVVPKLMQKYLLTFRQALGWASKDVQYFLMLLTKLRLTLPADVIYLIATHLAPITHGDARTIFSKVHTLFCIGVSTQVLNKYINRSTVKSGVDSLRSGVGLFNSKATIDVPPHHEQLGKLLTELAAVKDCARLPDIIKSHSDALKALASGPADDRLEKLLKYLVDRVNEVKGVTLIRPNNAVCVKG